MKKYLNSESAFSSANIVVRDVAKKSINGSRVALISKIATLLINFFGGAFLARLLDAEAYGGFAVAQLIIGTILLFRDSGMQTAGVKVNKITPNIASSLFSANIMISLLLTAFFLFSYKFIEILFGISDFVFVIIISCISCILGTLSSMHVTLLRRSFNNRIISIIDISSLFFGQLAAIGLALFDKKIGVYCLLIGFLCQQIALVILSFYYVRWIPKLISPKKFDGNVRFGVSSALASLVYFFTNNTSVLLIGTLVGANELGNFNRAQQIYFIPVNIIFGALSGVILSTLCRYCAEDRELYLKYYIDQLRGVSLFYCIIANVFITSGDLIIKLIFGENWNLSGTLLQCMGIGLLGSSMSQLTGLLYQSQGRFSEMRNWGFIDGAIRIVSMVVGWFLGGAIGIVLGMAVATLFITAPISIILVGNDGFISARHQFGVSCRNVFLAIALASLCLISRLFIYNNNLDFSLNLIAIAINYVLFFCIIIFIPFFRKNLPNRIEKFITYR